MRKEGTRAGKGGFSLLELMVALLLLQVGLLAVAGLVLTGQRILKRSDAVLRGTLEGRLVGDSILGSGAWSDGEREEPWGWLRWETTEEGPRSIRILALSPEKTDTLALLKIWSFPEGGLEGDPPAFPAP